MNPGAISSEGERCSWPCTATCAAVCDDHCRQCCERAAVDQRLAQSPPGIFYCVFFATRPRSGFERRKSPLRRRNRRGLGAQRGPLL